MNLARFDTKFVAVREILLSALWQGSLKALFISCAFIGRVAEAPADHALKVRGCSHDDKPVFIEEIQAGNQKVTPKYLKP